MQDEHDDDLAPTVKQRGDVETAGFSEIDETVLPEERDNDVDDNEPEDTDIVGK